MKTAEEILDIVIDAVQSTQDADTLVSGTSPLSWLHLDSLDTVEIIMEIEDELGLLFLDEGLISESTTVANLAAKVNEIYQKENHAN
jgi:acyl carrier protein